MPSPIESLPVELFDIILSNLDLAAYQSIRLSSRLLHLLSFSAFTDHYFSKLKTSLSASALERLIAIAGHQRFQHRVTSLDIRLLNFQEIGTLREISRIGIFPPPKRFAKLRFRPQQIADEVSLYDSVTPTITSKCIADRLSRALKGFKKLTIIKFRAHSTNSPAPDGLMHETDNLFRVRSFQAVIDAIVTSKIQLHEFRMAKSDRFVSQSKCANVPYRAFHLPLRTFQALEQQFSNLHSLSLSVSSATNGQSRDPAWEYALRNFVSSAPSLRHLALSFDSYQLNPNSTTRIFHSIAQSRGLELLQSFHLANCKVHEKDLVTFLTTHTETLQHLSLTDVQFVAGDWSRLWTCLWAVASLGYLRLDLPDRTDFPTMLRGSMQGRLKMTLDSQKARRPMSELLVDLAEALHLDPGLLALNVNQE